MAVKLIAADLDGTLLDSRKQLSPDFYPLVRQLRAQGIHFAPASGRQYYNLREVFAPMADALTYISENGAMVCDGNEVLSFSAMRRADAVRAVEIARRTEGVSVILSAQDGAFYENEGDSVFQENMAYYYAKRQHCSDLLAVARTVDVCKIALFCKNRAEQVIVPAFRSMEEQVAVVLSGRDWVDLMRLGMNKGDAIAVLCEKLQIRPEECMAFGDYLNDAELLRRVGQPYVMANAHPSMASLGQPCPSNDEDGVCRTIRRELGLDKAAIPATMKA